MCRVNVSEMSEAIYFQDIFSDLDEDFSLKDWQSGRKNFCGLSNCTCTKRLSLWKP